MIKRRLGATAMGIVASLVLAACGTYSAQFVLNTSVTTSASGNINLASYDSSIVPFDVLPPGVPATTANRSNGKGAINLKASYVAGNWNVSGTYADGDVKFSFSGYALELFTGIIPTSNLQAIGLSDSGGPTTPPGITMTQTGGTCLPVPTYYRSTNNSRPGTGWAIFILCDSGPANMSGMPDWTSPDYIKVWVPDESTTVDSNPWANYLNGGYMASKGKVTTVIKVTIPTTQSATPSALWPAPSSTAVVSSPPPSTTAPTSWTVTFNCGSGTGGPYTETVVDGQNATAAALPSPACTNSVMTGPFLGWSTDGINLAGTLGPIAADTTYVALYSPGPPPMMP